MSLWGLVGGIGGALLGGPAGAALGASIGGGLDQSNAVSGAANTQANATQAGIDEQRRQFDLTRADSAPYRAAGAQALGQLQTDINKPITAADVMQDPGYQFGMDQGQQALSRKFAAAGGRISGASMKAATRYGTDYAASGYGAAYQRGQDRLNRLAALAGIGQTTNSSNAASGANSANAISNMITSQGNAAGAAQIAQGNIWSNTGNQLAALYGRTNQTQARPWWNGLGTVSEPTYG